MIIKDGIAYDVKETEINVDALEAEKIKLEQDILEVPILKVKPDQETLDLWNSFIKSRINGIVNVQQRIDDIDSTLDEITELKEISIVESK